MYKILLATDGSASAAKALDETIKIAVPLNAEVTVLSVIGQAVNVTDYAGMDHTKLTELATDFNKAIEKRTQETVDAAVKPLEEKGIKVDAKVVSGYPSDTITRIAAEGNYDLIIMGNRGLSGTKEFFLGSVSNRVAHLANTSVLIVK